MAAVRTLTGEQFKLGRGLFQYQCLFLLLLNFSVAVSHFSNNLFANRRTVACTCKNSRDRKEQEFLHWDLLYLCHDDYFSFPPKLGLQSSYDDFLLSYANILKCYDIDNQNGRFVLINLRQSLYK